MANKKRSGWVDEFKRQVNRLKEKSKRDWYKHPQPSLKELKKTGQGNCVAWAHLSKEIAAMFNLPIFIIDVKNERDNTTWWSLHEATLVFDKDGTVWLQSNIYIHFCKRFRRTTKITFKKMLRAVHLYLRQRAKNRKWKTIPQVDNLWYYHNGTVERIIKDGKYIRKKMR
ncbi:MAG: hypothetical protein AAB965_00710 [Patescibacteria group bacterium]